MIGCWVQHTGGFTLINDSWRTVGEIKVMDDQIDLRMKKRLHEPARWFKIDGHMIKGKPPDQKGA